MEALPLIGQDGRPARHRLVFAAALSLLAVAVFAWAAGLREHAATRPGPGVVQPALQQLAGSEPQRSAEVIVQFAAATTPAQRLAILRALGGRDLRAVPIIHGVAGVLEAAQAVRLGGDPRVRAVSLNAPVKEQGLLSLVTKKLPGSPYTLSVRAPLAWARGATGKGVAVAVIDSGIAGDLPDFGGPGAHSSRVVGSVVTNPEATSAGDGYGHGTHVAGILAGNGFGRDRSDADYGRYVGIAPGARLVSVKVSDDAGNATVLDVIYGLQFAVDHKDDYGIRVINLSLQSTEAESYRTDPLDAAVEAAWFDGITVVAAAGNRGIADDAVDYAPGNDPYVITVGAIDDQATLTSDDDLQASWSSRGVTQDGFAKPEVNAPGAHIISTLAPGSMFASMCPSCLVGRSYIRAGGTSMAAPIVAGVVADVLDAHPKWTPDQVKAVLVRTSRRLGATTEVQAGAAVAARATGPGANQGLMPNELIDPPTGEIDPTPSSWSRSSWSVAPDGLTAAWARSSWSCDCSRTQSGGIDPTRSSWSRSSWSTEWGL